MPLYQYNCDCGKIIEVNHGMDEKRIYKCECGLQMYKDFNTQFLLKGTCWAKDGYENSVRIQRDVNYRNYYQEAKKAGTLPSHVLNDEKQRSKCLEII